MTEMNWTGEETALLIVLAMWGYEHEDISTLLTNRIATSRAMSTTEEPSYHRSTSSIQNKLNEVRSRIPGLWSRRDGWNEGAVIAHIYSSTVDHDLINQLLSLTAADIQAMLSVQPLLLLIE